MVGIAKLRFHSASHRSRVVATQDVVAPGLFLFGSAATNVARQLENCRHGRQPQDWDSGPRVNGHERHIRRGARRSTRGAETNLWSPEGGTAFGPELPCRTFVAVFNCPERSSPQTLHLDRSAGLSARAATSKKTGGRMETHVPILHHRLRGAGILMATAPGCFDPGKVFSCHSYASSIPSTCASWINTQP